MLDVNRLSSNLLLTKSGWNRSYKIDIEKHYLPGLSIRSNHIKFHWIIPQGTIVQWIFAIRAAQGPIDIVHVNKRTSENKVPYTHVLFAKRIFRIELMVSSLLACREGSQIGAAC